ncbi:MAG TPA: metal-sensitive transcriptional regulator [Terriglobales bacterium]|jgi:DNA-binding FrmR family transcriptional regulator|nr:metal-sensitive transcriptional regulator [Terriglobales bacterium]
MKARAKKNSEIAACGCETTASPRKAVGVDPEIKTRNLHRLNRIAGQVRGLQKMVEEDRYCADILMQISSVQEALRGVSRELMRNHLRHCVTQAVQHGSKQEAAGMYEEIVEFMFKNRALGS